MIQSDHDAIVDSIKFMPTPLFNEMCEYLGIVGEDYTILNLRYRASPSLTREYVAEEIGISPSTLDRRIKNIFKKIFVYGRKFIS